LFADRAVLFLEMECSSGGIRGWPYTLKFRIAREA